jgi:hypothetical protein
MNIKQFNQRLQEKVLPWLHESNPWTRYRTLIDLQAIDPNSKQIQELKPLIWEDPMVKSLAIQASEWMPQAASRNSDPKISYFTWRVLTDFGLDNSLDEISTLCSKAKEHIIEKLFAARGSLPERQKKGESQPNENPNADLWHICACNSPMISYCLAASGDESEQLKASIDELQNRWAEPQGWFCHLFFVKGQFKKTQLPCPMAGLMALDVFSLYPELRTSKAASNAFNSLVGHKEYGNTLYYFGRSKKFFKLKYPFVWYNGLYIADVISRYPQFHQTEVFQELVQWIESQADEDGRFTPQSIFMPYKAWDFGNKKQPSPWITLICSRILKRYYDQT